MKKEKDNILIEVNGLKKYFPIKKGIFQQTVGQIKAVDNINFKIKFEIRGFVLVVIFFFRFFIFIFFDFS